MASDTHTSSNRNRWQTVLVLALLTLIAYLLRTVGASSSVSYLLDTQLVRQALEIGESAATGEGFDLTQPFKYPLTLSYYLLGVFGAAAATGFMAGLFDSLAELEQYLVLNRAAVHLLAIHALNMLSVTVVPALYLAQRGLRPAHTGYLAAGLATFNLLLIQFGHQPRPHVPLATLSFVAVALLGYSLYHQRTWVLLLAALLTALTAGTLQNGIVILPVYALAYVLRPYDSHERKYHWQKLWSVKEAGGLLLVAVLTPLMHPALVQEASALVWGVFVQSEAATVTLGGGSHEISGAMFSVEHIPTFMRNLYGYQPLLTILLFPSLLYFVFQERQRRRLLCVVLLFPLVNLVVWMLFRNNLPRILAVFSPYMILSAAYLLEEVAGQLPRYWRTALFALVLVPLMLTSGRMVYVLAQPDTRVQATDWIVQNIEPGSTVLTNIQLYDLYPTHTAIERQTMDYPGSTGTVWAWLQQNEVNAPQYDIVNGHLYLEDVNNFGTLVAEHEVDFILVASVEPDADDVPVFSYAAANGTSVYTATPVADWRDARLPEALYDLAWWQVWQLRGPGPIVWIYDLRGA